LFDDPDHVLTALGYLQMPQYRPEFAWGTDVGRSREHNEDAVAVFPDTGLVVVADGIGGASAGDVASRLAIQAVGEHFFTRDTPPRDKEEALLSVEAAVSAANQVIWESSSRTPRYAGMGTTVVAGYVSADWLVFAHVGDSRLYRLRGGELVQLTRDHSLIQEVVDQGFFATMEEAHRNGINRNVLTRALGTGKSVKITTGEDTLRAGDLYLFCTDGLTGMVTDEGIRRKLLDAEERLDRLPGDLIDLACEGGGLDNITVALIRVSKGNAD